jgi:hypothetical protein
MTTAAQTRRDMIAARQQRSLAWRVIHALGSLKLALLLLGTLAIACAAATFYESRFDTKVAQAYIYKAPWFLFWLGVLCVNLFAVTLTRWPWQRKHTGFIITHYGIILLLVGAMIGSRFGFEGNVHLERGAKPTDRITVNRTLLRIEDPASGRREFVPFDPELARPSDRRPATIPVPGTPWKIVADGFSGNMVRHERLEPDREGRPGVELTFSSKMMGQQHAFSFLLGPGGAEDARDFFGRARLAWLPGLPDRAPLEIGETQVVFAKLEPVIQSGGPDRTGITFHLGADGRRLAITLPDGRTAEYNRADIQGRPQRFGDATFTVSDYWPDFTIRNGRPQSATMLPNNPAVLVRLAAPRPAAEGESRQPLLELTPTIDGIAYQLSRGQWRTASGTAKPGETFPLGWADWSATVTRALPAARLVSTFAPGPANEEGIPGFRAYLVSADGKPGEAQWLALGEKTALSADDASLSVTFGYELRPVPFTIELVKFEVPRLEGSDEPANFIATVEFRDSQTGATKQGIAQMNQPASWPGGFFAVTTGLNYKFSQASWNPANLDQTTLQVLYDPGWLFKWIGSLAICLGIFTMFYLRPRKS